jgi:serine/threonine protein kinase/tetratricopeptide (TPR) repeat protein
MIGTTVSHYKILEKLGGGGMGVVYKAQDLKLDRTVALKFLPPELTLDPEVRERFIHEAKAASALQHNNICNIHDIEETKDGQLFIVMDCYEGETLRNKIERGPLTIEEALDLTVQVAQGLLKAHEKGIIHRDIKPANIIITADGLAKIVDFGLAKLSGRTLLTKSGTTVGTVAYMSPEQARGDQVDNRSDIWSLGVVLYEMLTGKRPFASDYEQALVYSILNEDPKPMRELRPEMPEAMEKICRRAMAKNTDERYQSATELIADLEAYKSGSEISKQTRKVLSRKRRMLYAAGVGAVLLAAATIVFTFSRAEVFDSIAVLPFENVSRDSTQQAFTQGLTEEVIGKLWQVEALRVPSLKSVNAIVKSGMTYAEIAKLLKVKAVLDAPVQRFGTRVRITARLMDPATDKPLWSETYEREMADVLTLQTEVAQAIVRQVRVTLTPREKDVLAKAQRKVDPKAYELYLRARKMLPTYTTEEELRTIVRLVQQSIAIDSTYAPYHAFLSSVYVRGFFDAFLSYYDVVPKAEEAIQNALSLDSLDVETLTCLGSLRFAEWKMKEASAAFQSAIEHNPGNVNLLWWFGDFLVLEGRFGEAITFGRRVVEIDPTSEWNRLTLVGVYYYARRYDDAIRVALDGVKDFPNSVWFHNYLAVQYTMKGMKKEALAEMQKSTSIGVPEENAILMLNNAIDYALLGMSDKANRTLEHYLSVRKGKPVLSTWVSQAYAVLGNTDEAFQWLDRAYHEREFNLLAMKVDPCWDPVRSDPRFIAMLNKVGLEE